MDLCLWRYIPSDNYITTEPYYLANGVVDDYISLIWCERYQKPGEFELVLNATPDRLTYFKQNKNVILSRTDTDRAMFVESVNLKTNSRTGDILKLKGRSIESVFNRRIIEQTYTVSGRADDIAYHFIKENAANYWYYNSDSQHLPTIGRTRYINLLELDEHDALWLSEVEAQPFGQNLGEFIANICAACNVGYKVRFVDGKMLYSLYRGIDKTINQLVNDPVIFSSDFDNLGNTDFTIDSRTFYNSILVAGEGEGDSRTMSKVRPGINQGGIETKELFVDKRSVSSYSDGATNYGRLLNEIAKLTADASKETYDFYGEVLSGGKFKYRRDYNLGDTVTMQNPYGITGSATVSEVVETVDAVGYKVIPTFTEWRDEE